MKRASCCFDDWLRARKLRRFVSHASMTHVIEVDDPQGAGERDARLWLARRMGDGGLGPPCPKKTFRSIWGKIIILELRFFTKV